MARTPIPPRASADKNRRKSDRRNRCAMLIFSCFLLRTTGPVEVVLTDCTTQRYRIVSPEATLERKSTIRIPNTEDERLQPGPTRPRHFRESGKPRLAEGPRLRTVLPGRHATWRVYCGAVGMFRRPIVA